MENTDKARIIKYYESPNTKTQQFDVSRTQISPSLRGTLGNNEGESGKKPKNVKEHVGNVDDKLDQLKEESIEMKRNLEILRAELERINFSTDKNLDDFVNTLMAGINSSMKELQDNIEEQKEENANMQSQITELRKEHSEIQQRIIMGGKLANQLNSAVGKYEQDQ